MELNHATEAETLSSPGDRDIPPTSRLFDGESHPGAIGSHPLLGPSGRSTSARIVSSPSLGGDFEQDECLLLADFVEKLFE